MSPDLGAQPCSPFATREPTRVRRRASATVGEPSEFRLFGAEIRPSSHMMDSGLRRPLDHLAPHVQLPAGSAQGPRRPPSAPCRPVFEVCRSFTFPLCRGDRCSYDSTRMGPDPKGSNRLLASRNVAELRTGARRVRIALLVVLAVCLGLFAASILGKTAKTDAAARGDDFLFFFAVAFFGLSVILACLSWAIRVELKSRIQTS